ncbi:hypothetical protein ACO0RG_002952 [Hanseniaspora osmophila]
MKGSLFNKLAVSLTTMLCLMQCCYALPPLHINGTRFIKPNASRNDPETNEVFLIKGLDYQIGGSSAYDPNSGSDALTDEGVCLRDAFVFQQLGINTIRVYTLNPDLDHDKCFTILNNAGIYVLLDVNGPLYGENLDRSNPSGTYDSTYLTRVFKFLENFKNYPNVLGFFSGNEVINDQDDYAYIDPPYIRAVQRDIRQYLSAHPPSNRSSTIPIGYSAADNDDIRLPSYQYLQCNSLDGKTVDTDLAESALEFYGINSYAWGNDATWTTSGYNILNETFGKYLGRPIFFSEFGSIAQTPRTNGLLNTFSGGLVYEYSSEANNYGLVSVDSDDGSVTYQDDFVNLQKQYASLKLQPTKEADLEAPETSTEIIQCVPTAVTSEYASFGVQNFSIPAQPTEIASLIKNGVSANHTGAILTDYTPASTFSYKIYDTDTKEIDAKISYPSSNQLNAVYATSTSSSSSVLKSASSISSSSSSSAQSSSSSSKKSKNIANSNNNLQYGLLSVVFGGLLTFL